MVGSSTATGGAGVVVVVEEGGGMRRRRERVNRPVVPLPLPLPPPCASVVAEAVGGGEEGVGVEELERVMVLGWGSQGKVYKVRQRGSGQVFALKVIQEKDEGIRRQIVREMQILRSTNHRHVIRCHGVAERGGEVSFVLEYMDGGTLGEVVRGKGRMAEVQLAEVARQVLSGLCYLHRSKIVHRDIKPSNLLLNRKQEVKIGDFGVSTVLAHTLAQCNSFVGTCAYMSPERMNPDSATASYCGASADIWSLGLTLLECFLGAFPFPCLQKADWVTLMLLIGSGDPPPPPPDASPHFQNFLRSCLHREPHLRPSAASLLSHPFLYHSHPRCLASLLS